jgi:hypothetical protein
MLLVPLQALLLCAAEPPDFERDIAPLFVEHCLDCHHPNKRGGELNLSTLAGMTTGGEQGAALAPGKPDASLLLSRVEAREMPPPDAKEAKPLSPSEITTLRAWIAAGAPWPEGRQLGIHEKSISLDEARSFWSFQPVQRPSVPSVQNPQRVANPIDAFIWQRLDAAKLSPSPRAAPGDLLRRISLDIRGLPPTLDDLGSFNPEPEATAATALPDSARAPDAYERLTDRLLSDPGYGERWARHWLDLVRYADSSGYERDGPKPSVWRYRDYVIAALNTDKPYDRFVIEQLAGDELPDSTHETLIATGFHALGAWNDEVDPLEAAQYRADELDDMVRTTAQTFLGLTLGCARCHNHKFDPLTMVDYYGFAAILAPLKRPNTGRIDRDVPLGTPEQIAALKARNDELANIDKKILQLNVTERPPDAKERVAELRRRERDLRAKSPDLPGAYRCYEDSPEPPVTHLLLSGRASNPGPVVQPSVPAVLASMQPMFPPPQERSTLRRTTLAHWIASPNNPLTARVIVNRVWQHHFGEGLVATPSDFGQAGARPTHPELLDWLAHWFIHDANWSLKKLHRLILTSETYRQASLVATSNPQSAIHNPQSSDPQNRLLWHFPYRRLQVEAIRDSMLAAAGNLNRTMYGPAVNLPIQAAAVEAHTDKQAAWKPSKEPDINRRTVYAYVKRTLLVPMLEALDFCDTTQPTDRRTITSIAPQALILFNGDFVNRQAEQFATRLKQVAGPDPSRQIDLAFRLALSRPPRPTEAASMQQFLAQEAATTDPHSALIQLCRVLLNLNEFVYPN